MGAGRAGSSNWPGGCFFLSPFFFLGKRASPGGNLCVGNSRCSPRQKKKPVVYASSNLHLCTTPRGVREGSRERVGQISSYPQQHKGRSTGAVWCLRVSVWGRESNSHSRCGASTWHCGDTGQPPPILLHAHSRGGIPTRVVPVRCSAAAKPRALPPEACIAGPCCCCWHFLLLMP